MRWLLTHPGGFFILKPMRPPTIKVIRWLLLGLIAAVLLAVLANYLQFRFQRLRQEKKAPPLLSLDLKQSAEGLEIFERRGSDIRYKIRARRRLVTRADINILEGIEASDFNPDGSLHNSIRSQKAVYDAERKLADFSGDVRMSLSQGIELRTPALHYDLNSQVGTSSETLQLIAPEARGSARGIRFVRELELLELQSAVQLELTLDPMKSPDQNRSPDQIRASSSRATCSYLDKRILLEGGVRIESQASGTLTGDRVDIRLSPDGKRVIALTASGHANYQHAEKDETRRLAGDTMVFHFSAAGPLQAIDIHGDAALQANASAQEQSLTAARIRLTLDPAQSALREIEGQTGVKFRMRRGATDTLASGDSMQVDFFPQTGRLMRVDVRGQSAFSVADGRASAVNELRANEIHARFRDLQAQAALENLQADGAVRWTAAARQRAGGEARSLEAARLDIQYSSLGDYPERGNASGSVRITESLAKSPSRPQMRRLEADAVQFRFFPKTSQLRDLQARGHVRTTYERKLPAAQAAARAGSPEQLRASSDTLEARFVLQGSASLVESAVQSGNFHYQDGVYTAEAGRCEYSAVQQTLALLESPRITDDRSSTSGARMEYDLRGKVLQVQGRVRSILSAQRNRGALFQSSDAASPAIVTADTMRYWTQAGGPQSAGGPQHAGRIQYAGKVQALSESQQLQAGMLEILGNGERLEAQGGVRHLLFSKSSGPGSGTAPAIIPTIVQSSRLVYARDTNAVVYSGSVTLQSRGMTLECATLNGRLDPEGKAIQRARAEGAVVLRQYGRTCRGDAAEWDPEALTYEIFGNPAVVEDAARGRSYARRLTYFQADDRIVLEK